MLNWLTKMFESGHGASAIQREIDGLDADLDVKQCGGLDTMRGPTGSRVMACIAVATHAELVEPWMHLQGQLAVDSLDRCNIAQELEEAFSITIRNEDANQWQTVSDVITTVERTSYAGKSG
jgi:acyl carrier protein